MKILSQVFHSKFQSAALIERVNGALAVLQGQAAAVPIADAQRASPPEGAGGDGSRRFEFGRA
jgi:hypothetical protein